MTVQPFSGSDSPPVSPSSTDLGQDSDAMIVQMAIERLKQTRPWVLLVAVLATIGSAAGLIGLPLVVATPNMGNRLAVLFGYLLVLVPFVCGTALLYRYAISIKKLIGARKATHLVGVLSIQRGFWKYVGIATIVLNAVLLLAVIVRLLAKLMINK